MTTSRGSRCRRRWATRPISCRLSTASDLAKKEMLALSYEAAIEPLLSKLQRRLAKPNLRKWRVSFHRCSSFDGPLLTNFKQRLGLCEATLTKLVLESPSLLGGDVPSLDKLQRTQRSRAQQDDAAFPALAQLLRGDGAWLVDGVTARKSPSPPLLLAREALQEATPIVQGASVARVLPTDQHETTSFTLEFNADSGVREAPREPGRTRRVFLTRPAGARG